jgi:hypothetical protein
MGDCGDQWSHCHLGDFSWHGHAKSRQRLATGKSGWGLIIEWRTGGHKPAQLGDIASNGGGDHGDRRLGSRRYVAVG